MYLHSISVFWIVFFGFTFCSKAIGFENVPDDIIENHICKLLTHKEIVYAFSRLSHRFNTLSKKEITWKNTHITQAQNKRKREEFTLFLKEVSEKPKLPVKRLKISHRQILPDQLDILKIWISENNTLESLSLVKCGLTGDYYPNTKNNPFIEGFNRWMQLNKIELLVDENGTMQQNSFDKIANNYILVWKDSHQGFMRGLNTWLKLNKSLEELDLSHNPLKYSIASITESLEKNTGLKKLVLDNIYPEHDMFSETFNEDMAQNTTLQYFSFRNNKLKDAKRWLAPLFKRQSSLPAIQVDLTGTEGVSYHEEAF